jgi:transposase-like protein
MNIHKNARLTFARRLEMVQDVLEHKLTHAAAAVKHHVSVPTVRKWVGRYLTQGEPGLRDASSRPQISPRDCGQYRAGDRRAAASVLDARPHRPELERVREHRQSRAGASRLVALVGPGAERSV